MKELDRWLARPRPNGGMLDVIGRRCTCGRRIYAMAVEHMAAEFCCGCDAELRECYCPNARPEAVP